VKKNTPPTTTNTTTAKPTGKPTRKAPSTATTKPTEYGQLILNTDKAKKLPIVNAVEIRNQINTAIGKRAIVKVEVSKRNNIVLTTKEAILTAKQLLEDQQQWQQVFNGWPVTVASLPETWYKLVAHGVPNRPESLAFFAEDCTTDNPVQKVLGTPRWLKTPEESALAGSVVFAVSTEDEARVCMQNGLFIAGVKARVDRYRAFSTTTLCRRCSGLGHNPDTCRAKPRCKYCGKGHYTSSHCCSTCNANTPCIHAPAKCSHCPGAHESGSAECTAVQGLRPNKPRPQASQATAESAIENQLLEDVSMINV
jgi:hypothetical protein